MSKGSKNNDGLFSRLMHGLIMLGMVLVVTLGVRLGWSLYFISFLVLVLYGFITGSEAVKKYSDLWRMIVVFGIFLMFIVVLGGLQSGVGTNMIAVRAFEVMIGVFGISRVILSVLATFEEI